MNMSFNGQEKVGEIVAKFPGAAELFKHYKIDFCCGGDRQLSVVAKEQGIDVQLLLSQLNKLFLAAKAEMQSNVDWSTAPLDKLISHIINTHHSYLQRELPAISELLGKILRVHGASHPELAKVHRLFHLLKIDLEQHLIAEETALFPQIIEYLANSTKARLDIIKTLIQTIESEHDQAGDILKQLNSLTDYYAIPADACESFRLAYLKLRELESDLFQHIHLENNILHPRLASPKV